MQPIIDIRHLSLQYDGQKLYDDFSFRLNAGEKVTLAGESGSGKTTFLHLILGFIPYQQGRITIFNHPLRAENIAFIRSQTAYVPQELHLPHNTASELFYMPFTFRQNRLAYPTRKKIQYIFQALGLSMKLLDKNLDEISGGQKQRVAIASALLLKKPLLILDEPTASLDERSIQRLTSLVFNQNHQTVLATSHHQYWIAQSERTYNLDQHGTNT